MVHVSRNGFKSGKYFGLKDRVSKVYICLCHIAVCLPPDSYQRNPPKTPNNLSKPNSTEQGCLNF